MRMDFLSIFLEDFRGPRKTNYDALQAKSTNFQGLVFIPKTEKLLLWHLK